MKNGFISTLNFDFKADISGKSYAFVAIIFPFLYYFVFKFCMFIAKIIRKILANYTTFELDYDPFFNIADFVYPNIDLYMLLIVITLLIVSTIQRLNAIFSNKIIKSILILIYLTIFFYLPKINFYISLIFYLIFVAILCLIKTKHLTQIIPKNALTNFFTLNFNTKTTNCFFILFNIFAFLAIVIMVILYFISDDRFSVIFIFAMLVQVFLVCTPFLYIDMFYIFNNFNNFERNIFRLVLLVSFVLYAISFITLDRKSEFYSFINLAAFYSFLFLYIICFIYIIICGIKKLKIVDRLNETNKR